MPTTSWEEQLRKLLLVIYLSPHASPGETIWKERRCEDCFCTIQTVHSHSYNKELVEPLTNFIRSEITRALEEVKARVPKKEIELLSVKIQDKETGTAGLMDIMQAYTVQGKNQARQEFLSLIEEIKKQSVC